MTSIRLENLQKTFGKATAVDRLDLDIREGEFFTFLGPSGCGKTTTLRMIAGFYYPSRGSVHFGDRDVTRLPPEKRNTGMVFQNYALFPHMTVFENVAFGLKARKTPGKEIHERVESVLEKVRLGAFRDRQVNKLSGGQQQRVALARALVIEPGILLLDEPLSNLDAKLREEMRVEILRLQKEYHITTIYVTHDQTEALSMSDRIAVFNEGICHQVGTPAEIYGEPANDFVAGFVGEINLLPIEAAGEKDGFVSVSLRDTEVRLLAENKKLTDNTVLAVRPEAIGVYGAKPDIGTNLAEGTVESVQFFGASIQMNVSLAPYQIKISMLNSGRTGIVEPGQHVWLHLPAENLRLIERTGGVPIAEK